MASELDSLKSRVSELAKSRNRPKQKVINSLNKKLRKYGYMINPEPRKYSQIISLGKRPGGYDAELITTSKGQEVLIRGKVPSSVIKSRVDKYNASQEFRSESSNVVSSSPDVDIQRRNFPATRLNALETGSFIDRNQNTFPSFQQSNSDGSVSGVVYGGNKRLSYSYIPGESALANKEFDKRIKENQPVTKQSNILGDGLRLPNTIVELGSSTLKSGILGGLDVTADRSSGIPLVQKYSKLRGKLLGYSQDRVLMDLDSHTYGVAPITNIKGEATTLKSPSIYAGLLPGKQAVYSLTSGVYDVAESPRYLTGGQATIFASNLLGKGVNREKITTSEWVSAGAYALPYAGKGLEVAGSVVKFKVPWTLPESVQIAKLKISRDVVKAKQSLGGGTSSVTDLFKAGWNTPLKLSTPAGGLSTKFTVGGVIDKATLVGFGGLALYGWGTGRASFREDIARPIGFGIQGMKGLAFGQGVYSMAPDVKVSFNPSKGLLSSKGSRVGKGSFGFELVPKSKVEISRIATAKQLTGDVRYGTYDAIGKKAGSAKQEINFFKESPYVMSKSERALAKASSLDQVWTAKPDRPGKFRIIRAGSSEVSGEYSAPMLDIEFLKLPNRQASSYRLGGLFTESPSPTAVRAKVKGFNVVKGSGSSLVEEQAVTDVLYPFEGFKVRKDYLNAQSTVNELYGSGIVTVPRQKAELEAIGTGASRLTGNKFFTTVPSEKQAQGYSFFFRKGVQESYTRVGKLSWKPSSYRNLYYKVKGYKPGQFYSYGINKGISVPIQEREYVALTKKSMLSGLFDKASVDTPLSASKRSSQSVSVRGIGSYSFGRGSFSSSGYSSRLGSLSYGSFGRSSSSSKSSYGSSILSSVSSGSRSSRTSRSSSGSSGSSSVFSKSSSGSSGSSSLSSLTDSVTSFPKSYSKSPGKRLFASKRSPIRVKYGYAPSVIGAFMNVKSSRPINWREARSGLFVRPLLVGGI